MGGPPLIDLNCEKSSGEEVYISRTGQLHQCSGKMVKC